jgi:hypothetical protein
MTKRLESSLAFNEHVADAQWKSITQPSANFFVSTMLTA